MNFRNRSINSICKIVLKYLSIYKTVNILNMILGISLYSNQIVIEKTKRKRKELDSIVDFVVEFPEFVSIMKFKHMDGNDVIAQSLLILAELKLVNLYNGELSLSQNYYEFEDNDANPGLTKSMQITGKIFQEKPEEIFLKCGVKL